VRSQLAAELLREGRCVSLPATGTSMRPLLPPGGNVTVHPVRLDEVRLGDVVVVVGATGTLVAHRLMRVTPTSLVLRGDAMPDDDPPVPHAALVGRVDVPLSAHAFYCAVRALLRR
jgi:hypothetical protein